MFRSLDIFIQPSRAGNFVVNTLTDAADINPGDGICDSDAGTAGSQCSLRAAIQEANALAGDDVITFDPGISGAITLLTSLPDINTNLTITGPGAGLFVTNGLSVVTIGNSTIANNRTDVNGTSGSMGGGILVAAGAVNLRNTIVAGNFRGPGSVADDISGTLQSSSSFNLIGMGGSGGLTDGVNNNHVGVSNPGIAALAENGGPTQTQRLLPGSPAIDAGDDCVLTNSCTPGLGFLK